MVAERIPRAGLLRIGTFRVPVQRSAVHAELRALAPIPWGRVRWIGRRLIDDPDGAEVCVLSIWDDEHDMDAGVPTGQARFSPDLLAAIQGMRTEVYACRALGTWKREDAPQLMRLFRGELVAGDPNAFVDGTAARYLGNFERNSRCVSIAVGLSKDRQVILATLWTSWDAVVTATGGDLRQILPIQLPPYELVGNAVHYELVAAEPL